MKLVRYCLLLSGMFMALSLAAQKRPELAASNRKAKIQYGTASYYSNKFQGRETASGIPYDKDKMTCAHNSLPLGTWVKVTNLRNGKSVIVKVTDRLHYKNKRLVDLSRVAASKLGYLSRGLTRVKLVVLGTAPPAAAQEH